MTLFAVLLAVVTCFRLIFCAAVGAFDWVPSEEEIRQYRRSWNPMTNGPILISGVDIQPKGQFLFQPFVFGEVGHQRFGNELTTDRIDSPFHLRAVAPTGIFAYGITDHLELNVAFSGIYWEASRASAVGGRVTDAESGVGDTIIYLKYRPIVQDPDSWRPTITVYNQIALPSSQWFGTQSIPGSFSPLGRLPATRFGALSITEGLMFRKKLPTFSSQRRCFLHLYQSGQYGGHEHVHRRYYQYPARPRAHCG